MTCWSSAVWMVVKNNYRIDFETTKGTKIAKIQSTKYTKQTISLADVGLGADESALVLMNLFHKEHVR